MFKKQSTPLHKSFLGVDFSKVFCTLDLLTREDKILLQLKHIELLFFYCDFYLFSQYNQRFSGDSYLIVQNFPVSMHIRTLFTDLYSIKSLRIEKGQIYFQGEANTLITNTSCNETKLSKIEIEIIKEASEKMLEAQISFCFEDFEIDTKLLQKLDLLDGNTVSFPYIQRIER